MFQKDPKTMRPKSNLKLATAGTCGQVVRLEKHPTETQGWKRWKISLPQSFRSQWLDDVVFSHEWKELLWDFDSKLLGKAFCLQLQ